jgi:two-component sensor histidine kinase
VNLVSEPAAAEGSGRWSRVRRRLLNVALGILAAETAVLLRFLLPLPPDVLPFAFVIIAVCVITVAAGFVGGVTTMLVGGVLTWYYLLSPGHSWDLDGRGIYFLIGYFSVTGAILATSQMYRRSEERRQAVALELAMREAGHQHLFAREMAHRLKNAMAIVQAMASQTFSRDTPEVAKFNGRLLALAEAHNLLNEHVKEPTASLTEVVETAVAPFRDTGERFRVSGPQLPLPDQQVVSLSIALHELGTNAVKYGALKQPGGWVSIDWRNDNGALILEWKEHDGPPVRRPTREGFGTRLLKRSAMRAEVSYEPDGLRCVITGR